MKPFYESRRPLALLLLVCLATALGYGAAGFPSRIENRLFAFFPAGAEGAGSQGLAQRYEDYLSQRVFWVVCGSNPAQAAEQLGQLRLAAVKSGLFAQVADPLGQRAFNPAQLLSQYAGVLMAPEARAQFANPQGSQALLERLQRKLGDPLGVLDLSRLSSDPLLLGLEPASLLPANSKLEVYYGWPGFQKDRRHCLFLALELKDSAFSKQHQEQYLQLVGSQQVRLLPGQSLESIGAVHFAHYMQSLIETDLRRISVVSLLGILAMLVLVFRSLRPLLLFLLMLGLAGGVALSLTLTLFGEIHALALVIGATLIGVCVDYLFHWIVVYQGSKQEKQESYRGLVLALLTSLLAYGVLALTPVPGIRQAAWFSLVGLAVSFIAAFALFPLLIRPQGDLPAWSFRLNHWLLWTWGKLEGLKPVLPWVILGLLGWGILHTSPRNDLRLFRAFDANMLAQHQEFLHSLGNQEAQTWGLLTADSETALAQEAQELAATLRQAKAAGELQDYFLALEQLATTAQQKENQALLKAFLAAHEQELLRGITQLGFDPALSRRALTQLQAAQPPLMAKQWMQEVYPLAGSLWLEQKGRVAVAFSLAGPLSAPLQQRLASHKAVTLLDKPGQISKLLDQIQEQIIWLLLLAYLGIALFFFDRFGWRQGVNILSVPSFGLGLGLLVLAVQGLPLSLFHLIGLILVLGIGIDYAIFFAEHPQGEDKLLLACFLSMLSTILSFGLLALSQIPALAAIGQVVGIGILGCFLVAPLALHQGGRRVSWLYRVWAPLGAGLGFVVFGLGALAITLLVLPLADLWPGAKPLRRRKLVHRAFGWYFWLLGDVFNLLYLRVKGLEKQPIPARKPLILLANHPSLLDYVAIAAAQPDLCCLVKQAVWENPYYGKLVRKMGFVALTPEQEILNQCAQVLQTGQPLLIFPEGTRSPVEGLHPFNKGAMYLAIAQQAWVFPVFIQLDFPILKKGWKWYQMPKGPITMTVEFLPLLEAAKWESDPLRKGRASKELAKSLEECYRNLLAGQPSLPTPPNAAT